MHEKIINLQNQRIANEKIKNTQPTASNQSKQVASLTDSIQESLSDLWKNSKVPNAAQIKETLNAIYTTIQNTFKTTISDPIKNTIFKQATDTIPNGKDAQQVDSWMQTIQKSIYRFVIYAVTRISSNDAESMYQGPIYKATEQAQNGYCQTKYFSYAIGLDMYKVIYPTTADIAHSMSNAIIKDLTTNLNLSQSDIDAINARFVDAFTQWADKDETLLLEDAYKTLGLDPQQATAQNVKQAYRKLSLTTHPDKQGGNAAAFQKIKGAYDTINNFYDTSPEAQKQSEEDAFEARITAFNKLTENLVKDINAAKLKFTQKIEANKTQAKSQLPQGGIALDVGDITTNTNGTINYEMPRSQVSVNTQGKVTGIGSINE